MSRQAEVVRCVQVASPGEREVAPGDAADMAASASLPRAVGRTGLALATRALLASCLLALPAAPLAFGQYIGKVGQGAEQKPTLRSTAVLEWTGELTKPSASRLIPIAVWDGERYQPGGLYMAQPAPLALENGTQYVLERAGETAGLFDVSAAANFNGGWVGLGKYQPEYVAPPPKLKPSKKLPTLHGGGKSTGSKADSGSSSSDGDRPTLHRSGGGGSGTGSGGSSSGGTSSGSTTSGTTTTGSGSSGGGTDAPADPNSPTLHRRTNTDSSGSGSSTSGASTTSQGGAQPSPQSGNGSSGSASSSGAGSSQDSSRDSDDSDPNRPVLHRHAGSDPDDTGSSTGSSSKGSSSGGTKTADANAPDSDPDRPTLHAHKSSSAEKARAAGGTVTSVDASDDPDRPHLRRGVYADAGAAAAPARLEGVPVAMQQIVAVSDTASDEPHQYHYQWAAPGDALKMQDALAAIAAKAAGAAVPPPAQAAAGSVAGTSSTATSPPPAGNAAATGATGKASSTAKASSTGTTVKSAVSRPLTPAQRAAARRAQSAASAMATLEDIHFSTYELSYSGGATLIYSAHTSTEGGARRYVTLIAHPDFYGQPQVIFKQVSRADELDQTPAMRLVDAVDTDNDHRAELIFELIQGDALAPPPGPVQAGPAPVANDSSRQFAIYRVENGSAEQVFATGPLP